MVYLLRSEEGRVRAEHERFEGGLFSLAEWLDTMSEVGFHPTAIFFEHSEPAPGTTEVLLGVKPGI